jgi:hypothetical protein
MWTPEIKWETGNTMAYRHTAAEFKKYRREKAATQKPPAAFGVWRLFILRLKPPAVFDKTAAPPPFFFY